MAEEEDMFRKDGTTDFRNKPALKKQTGSWKACPYILGAPSQTYLANLKCTDQIYSEWDHTIQILNTFLNIFFSVI
ncbi:hypothetical protein CsSME_00017434 [Camellia sinensis var. sinensis]